MSLLALGLAFTLQGAATHASLHPDEVDLFLEVPNVPAVLAAYDGAPMVRMLRDEDVRAAIEEMTGDVFDFDQMLSSALQEMVPPPLQGLAQSVVAVSASVAVADGTGDSMAGPPISFTVIAEFAAEDPAQGALTMLVEMAQSSEPCADSPLPGATTLDFRELAGLPVWAVTVGPRLIVGAGAQQLDGLAARLDSQGAPSLAANPLLAAARSNFDPEGGATIMRGFLARSPVDLLERASPLDGLAEVATQVEQLTNSPGGILGGQRCWRMQLVDGRFLTEMLALHGSEESTSPSVLGGRALDPSWLAPIPADAMLVYTTALEGSALRGLIERALAAYSRQTGQEIDLAAIDTELGIPLSEVCGSLGPGLVVYAKELRGVGIPETYAWIELGDPAAFQEHVAAFSENVGAKFPGFGLRMRDYRVKDAETGERRTFPICTLGLPPGLLDLPLPISLSPAFTVADGKLLASLSSMHLKRELKRMYRDGAANGAIPASPPGASGKTAWGVELPPTAESLIVMDWGRLVGGLVSLARGLGPYAPIPFDATAIPEPEMVTRHFRPTVHYSRPVEGGTYRRHEASFGPEVWLGAAIGGAMAFRITEASAFGPSGMPTPQARVDDPTPPADSDGQDLATKIALQKVHQAIAIHHLELGSYPEALSALVEPQPSFPRGYLEEAEVPRDGWGHTLRYERAADANTYRLWSIGPNGLDEGGDGDDVSSP